MPVSYPKRGTTIEHYAIHSSFNLVADPEAIPKVVEAVVRIVTKHCGHLIEGPAIALVVQEALANAVVHGCGRDSRKQVQCEVGCDPHLGVLLVVRDPGPGFDVRSSQQAEKPSELSDHGRGIYLIRQFMDDVRFFRNGAEIRMRKFPVGMKATA